MGVWNSTRRRRRMDDRETGESTGHGRSGSQSQRDGNDDEGYQQNRDLAVLSYLIRSGQVRIWPFGGQDGDDDEDDEFYEEDEFDAMEPAASPRLDRNPDTSEIASSEFAHEVLQQSGLGIFNHCDISACKHKIGLNKMLNKREVGMHGNQSFSPGNRNLIGCNYLPNKSRTIQRFQQKAFCGTYSTDGDIFLSACQDQKIRIYDTRNGGFRLIKTVRAKDVGWSVLDTAFSPDGNFLIYSSWSDSIHLCNIFGEQETHVALSLCRDDSRTAIFSLTFSSDNLEILGGSNDQSIYIYSRELNERILRVHAHEDDVNAVAFADSTSQILFSGGDDGLVKVWDRRMLSDDNPAPVGVLAGHTDGITFIDSKGDARYLISNCKDQTIKLWDIRKFSSKSTQEATRRQVARQRWDYRWEQCPKRLANKRKKIEGDTSLMTYRGHSVLHTLVRCRFSPAFTTGQRYIYTGSATGAGIGQFTFGTKINIEPTSVYDALTGGVVSKLKGHRACVRDISWHPYEHKIITSSWDGTLNEWSYRCEDSDPEDSGSSTSSDSEADPAEPRRSKRIRRRRTPRLFSLS